MIGLFTRLFSKTKTDFARLIREGSIIIDVRSALGYKNGHIKGSENIPFDELNTKIGYFKKLNKPLITVCRSGSRSRMAKSILTANGLVAYNGGSWYAARLALYADNPSIDRIIFLLGSHNYKRMAAGISRTAYYLDGLVRYRLLWRERLPK